MSQIDEFAKMLVLNTIRLYIFTFLIFFAGRFLLNDFLQEIPDSFISSASHLLSFNFIYLKKILHLLFFSWLAVGILVLIYTDQPEVFVPFLKIKNCIPYLLGSLV